MLRSLVPFSAIFCKPLHMYYFLTVLFSCFSVYKPTDDSDNRSWSSKMTSNCGHSSISLGV
ncbi:hypothetical protein BYT27DRAFT_6629969 [Phlegmacium glaucopus]|nr:hypothetical protein BYT27DRAFT_6629969 [Phlegmacium glaucopus]